MASVQFGNYQIMRKIGAGGMAQVFEAQRVGLEGFSRRVALKCILPEMTRDHRFVEMFVNEARLGSQLHHPNIVEIQDFNKVNDVYYIAMEYVEGVDLGEVISRFRDEEREFPPGLATDITIQALEGLGYAHEASTDDGVLMNIIHRDIKPSNLMLTTRGTVKIADFGIAKAATNAYQTRTSEVTKGSLAYMAPEQITREAPISPASDLFSLGAVLFEMLQLRALFDGDNMPSIMFKVAQVEIDRDLSELEKHYPLFIPILQRALARELENRYTCAAEMCEALQSIRGSFDDEPTIETLVREFVTVHHSEQDDGVGEQTISMLGLDRDPAQAPPGPTDLSDFVPPPNLKPPPAPIRSNPQFNDAMYRPAASDPAVEAGDSQPSLSVTQTQQVRPTQPRAKLFVISLLVALMGGLVVAGLLGRMQLPALSSIPFFGSRPAILMLQSSPPEARVFLDGVPQTRVVDGRVVPILTPAKLKLTDDGIAVIMLLKDGYEPFEKTLNYHNGEVIPLSHELVKILEFGTVMVDSTPQGARISLDDLPTGRTTPARLEKIGAGRSHVVGFELEGYVTATEIVKVVKDDTVLVEQALDRAEKTEAPDAGKTRVATRTGAGSNASRNGSSAGIARPDRAHGSSSSDTQQRTLRAGAEEGGTKTTATTAGAKESPASDTSTNEPLPPGKLVVNCMGNCFVYVDGGPRHKAPPGPSFSLTPGKHKVKVEDYEGGSTSFDVTIESGRTATRIWDLNSRKILSTDEDG